MKKQLKDLFKKLTPWSVDENFHQGTGSQTKYELFELIFENKKIGILKFANGKWTFEYSDFFKENQFILPLIDFPDIEKKYEFDELAPFFASRIPSLNQPFHEMKLEKNEVNKRDLASLLKIFGEKSINNPFELKNV